MPLSFCTRSLTHQVLDAASFASGHQKWSHQCLANVGVKACTEELPGRATESQFPPRFRGGRPSFSGGLIRSLYRCFPLCAGSGGTRGTDTSWHRDQRTHQAWHLSTAALKLSSQLAPDQDALRSCFHKSFIKKKKIRKGWHRSLHFPPLPQCPLRPDGWLLIPRSHTCGGSVQSRQQSVLSFWISDRTRGQPAVGTSAQSCLSSHQAGGEADS